MCHIDRHGVEHVRTGSPARCVLATSLCVLKNIGLPFLPLCGDNLAMGEKRMSEMKFERNERKNAGKEILGGRK